jgi:hypothetical protein
MENNLNVTSENLERDIDAIEAEKKEYIENGDVAPEGVPRDISSEMSTGGKETGEVASEEEVEEEVAVDEMEFNLTPSEIDEWISELTRLKEEKGSIELAVDDENDLVIKYEEESEDDSEEEEAPEGVPRNISEEMSTEGKDNE